MKSMYRDQSQPEMQQLAMTPTQAARALNLSPKKLWLISQPRGSLPCLKLGSRVAYFPHQIQQWADEELARQQREAEQAATQGGSK